METCEWGIDRTALIDLLSLQLYREEYAFLRELISNSVDAIQRRPESTGKVLIELTNGKVLTISDDGCGIAFEELRAVVAMIGVSGTSRWQKTSLGSTATPIGRFGIGLLSTRIAASCVELRSWTDCHGTGALWRWSGGTVCQCARLPCRGTPGTIVELTLRLDTPNGRLDDRTLRRWIVEQMPYVNADVFVSGIDQSLTSRIPPWRSCGSEVVIQDFTQASRWIREPLVHDFARLAAVAANDTSRDGAAVLWPSEHSSPNTQLYVYRSGVRLPAVGDLLPREYEWVNVLVDLPEVDITLDRSSIVPDAKSAAADTVEALTRRAIVALMRDEAVRGDTSAGWWERYRGSVLRCVSFILQNPPEQFPVSFAPLLGWIHFSTDDGPLSINAIAERIRSARQRLAGILETIEGRGSRMPRPEVFVVRWSDEYDRIVFVNFARQVGLHVGHWSDEEDVGFSTASAPFWPAGAVELIELVRAPLARSQIDVSLAGDFANSEDLARWEVAPNDEVHTGHGLAYAPSSLRRNPARQAELKVNGRSPAVQSLGRLFCDLDKNSRPIVAWALCAWASVRRSTHLRQRSQCCDKISKSLFALADALPIRSIGCRCFVAYDWTRGRDEYAAVASTLRASPFEYQVIDAAAELKGAYIMENVLKCMQSCHLNVAILTHRCRENAPITSPSVESLNPNVLIEVGMALGMRSRPLVICVSSELTLPADLDGILVVPYDSTKTLRQELTVTLKKLGLHEWSGREN